MKQTWRTVQELLGNRRDVYRIDPDQTILAALRLMAEKNVGALIVCTGDHMVGIVSERDYARKVECVGKTAAETKVREIMTPDVIYVSPSDKVDHCLRLMRKHRVRHLPVVENQRIVGVLSTRNVVEEVIREDEHLIQDLQLDRLRMTTDTGTY
jgi:CBS domain-containing protein